MKDLLPGIGKMRLALRYIFFSGVSFALSSLFSFQAHSQERCATVEYSKSLHPDYNLRRLDFERWLSEKRISRTSRSGRRQDQQATYKVPVVVHVIHNGEAIGIGPNITDEQILSQIRVLNEDFSRNNADAVNTPAQFASVAAGMDIEFVLARQDPDGAPTNGIVRVNGGRNAWATNDNYTLKALSYWPAEQYLNIWVCNLSDGFVGFAQFPESDLEGLEASSKNRLTDGVVIWYRAFGSSDDGVFNLDPVFNKGRTTTHEVGHFFGLLHIWGDDAGCAGTDHVADTPNQANRTQGCPSHPKSDACSEVVMFQNFLDYTDDNCMNLFTQGQVDRMAIVIENSPRRASLLTSPGALEPDPLPNDIGIRTIIFPDASVCSTSVTPEIQLRNYGNNTINSTRIRFSVDGSVRETRDFTLSLAPGQSTQVTFSAQTITSGTHGISFEVLLTNGVSDAGEYNNAKSSQVIIPGFSSVPFAVDFNAQPPGWITYNPDGQITWSIVTAPHDASNNRALKLDYFNYEDKVGEVDAFLSPVFDLSAVPAASLTFDVAHARYQSSNDRLKVVVLTDCEDITHGTTVYNKAGDTLKTAPSTTSPFTPSGASQWRREYIDLSTFVGNNRVQFAFVGINDWGNNIFIDNVSLITEAVRDISILGLGSPALVTCDNTVPPTVVIRNAGSIVVDEVVVQYAVNGGAVQSLTVPGLGMTFGSQRTISLEDLQLQSGENIIDVTVTPSGSQTDHNPSNNTGLFKVVVNDSREIVPLRENFEGDFSALWVIANASPEGQTNWQATTTNLGTSLFYNGFQNDRLGEQSWLVSPTLDFSGTSQASMTFDISYNPPAGGPRERLSIFASTDCGSTFEELPFDMPNTGSSNASWKPSRDEQWTKGVTVNLSAFSGQDNVRIAFVVTNEGGNNLYLDNIEFFVTSTPAGVKPEQAYSIYGYSLEDPELTDLHISFNLSTRQDVRYSVINTLGQMEIDGILMNVLNQTFPLQLKEKLSPGIYFIRLEIDGKFHTTRVLVF